MWCHALDLYQRSWKFFHRTQMLLLCTGNQYCLKKLYALSSDPDIQMTDEWFLMNLFLVCWVQISKFFKVSGRPNTRHIIDMLGYLHSVIHFLPPFRLRLPDVANQRPVSWSRDHWLTNQSMFWCSELPDVAIQSIWSAQPRISLDTIYNFYEFSLKTLKMILFDSVPYIFSILFKCKSLFKNVICL